MDQEWSRIGLFLEKSQPRPCDALWPTRDLGWTTICPFSSARSSLNSEWDVGKSPAWHRPNRWRRRRVWIWRCFVRHTSKSTWQLKQKKTTCTLQAVSQEVDWNIQKCLSSANVSSILEPNLLVETNTELKAHEEAGQGPEVQPWHH